MYSHMKSVFHLLFDLVGWVEEIHNYNGFIDFFSYAHLLAIDRLYCFQMSSLKLWTQFIWI